MGRCTQQSREKHLAALPLWDCVRGGPRNAALTISAAPWLPREQTFKSSPKWKRPQRFSLRPSWLRGHATSGTCSCAVARRKDWALMGPEPHFRELEPPERVAAADRAPSTSSVSARIAPFPCFAPVEDPEHQNGAAIGTGTGGRTCPRGPGTGVRGVPRGLLCQRPRSCGSGRRICHRPGRVIRLPRIMKGKG